MNIISTVAGDCLHLELEEASYIGVSVLNKVGYLKTRGHVTGYPRCKYEQLRFAFGVIHSNLSDIDWHRLLYRTYDHQT